MSTPPGTARIFGFVAAEADVCVLLRRSPAKKSLMIRWNLATDEFELGQWLFKQIYGYGCDLSPSGELFTYRAVDGHYLDPPGGIHTVISRPPYFTALALWGGGSYSSSLGFYGPGKFHPSAPPIGSLPEIHRKKIFLGDPLLCAVGRGWTLIEGASQMLLRPSVAGELVWKMNDRRWPGKYELNGEPLDARWADVDHRGRLLFARNGHVLVHDGSGERDLIDLNPLFFRSLAPAPWAERWP